MSTSFGVSLDPKAVIAQLCAKDIAQNALASKLNCAPSVSDRALRDACNYGTKITLLFKDGTLKEGVRIRLYCAGMFVLEDNGSVGFNAKDRYNQSHVAAIEYD